MNTAQICRFESTLKAAVEGHEPFSADEEERIDTTPRDTTVMNLNGFLQLNGYMRTVYVMDE